MNPNNPIVNLNKKVKILFLATAMMGLGKFNEAFKRMRLSS